MKKDLIIMMEEECITCPMLSLETDSLYFDGEPGYQRHRCKHIDFCKRVRENWEKYRKEDNDE